MYTRSRFLLLGLVLLAAPARGQAAEGLTLTAPDGTPVTIERDTLGVPHILAGTEPAAFFGQGFATAQDRLFQMETIWRAATGRLAEIDPSQLATDRAVRTVFYTPEEREAQFDALPAPVQAMTEAYVAGINAYIDSTEANPERYLPYQYTQFPMSALGIEAWTVEKAVAVMQFYMRRFGEIGGEEMARLAELQEHGPAWFEQNRPINDPAAPTTIRTGGAPEAPPAAAAYEGPWVDPALAAEVAATRARLERALAEAGVPARLGSFAAVVGPSRSASGNVLLLGAPQMGQPTADAPGVTLEVELLVGDEAAPALHIAGMTVPGIPGVIIGRNRSQAWTLTTGYTDNTDTFVEVLDETRQRYLHDGAFHPLEAISETIHVLGQEPVEYVHYRTVHGPVYALDAESGQAFAYRYAFWERELDMPGAFYRIWKGESLADFEAAAANITMSFNLFYADKAQNIAFWHVGLYPQRPGTADPRLPLLGTGEQEWLGFLDFEAHPQAVNPPQGYFANWNNKPAPWWNQGDNTPWTAHPPGSPRPYDGVLFLEEHLLEHAPMTFAELQELTCVVRSNPRYPEYPGTYQQVIEFAEDASYAENVVPPGQSGFINIHGVPSPHVADQWAFYQSSIACEDVQMGPFTFIGEPLIEVAAEPGAVPAKGLGLGAAYPNPSGPGALRVPYRLERPGPVRLEVVDVLGRTVAVLVDGHAEAGAHEATLEAGRLASGAYVLRLSAGGETRTQRMTVVR